MGEEIEKIKENAAKHAKTDSEKKELADSINSFTTMLCTIKSAYEKNKDKIKDKEEIEKLLSEAEKLKNEPLEYKDISKIKNMESKICALFEKVNVKSENDKNTTNTDNDKS